MRLLLPVLMSCVCLSVTGSTFADDKEGEKKDVKPYPLKTCIISGEELGSMGKPVVVVHKGQEVKFCCKSCIKDFNKDPDAIVKKALEGKENKESK